MKTALYILTLVSISQGITGAPIAGNPQPAVTEEGNGGYLAPTYGVLWNSKDKAIEEIVTQMTNDRTPLLTCDHAKKLNQDQKNAVCSYFCENLAKGDSTRQYAAWSATDPIKNAVNKCAVYINEANLYNCYCKVPGPKPQ